jgi:hypothetical protein
MAPWRKEANNNMIEHAMRGGPPGSMHALDAPIPGRNTGGTPSAPVAGR